MASLSAANAQHSQRRAGDVPASLLVATYNIEDVRTPDITDPRNPRLRAIAKNIVTLRPDILLINEIEYDWPADSGGVGGMNGQRFADAFLNSDSVRYRAYMPESNTGIASGFDLDRDGAVGDSLGTRAYGNDAWGFGTFPGQYGMAVLVSDPLEINERDIRTFRRLRWASMPGALRPMDRASGGPWYRDEIWSRFPLSSKTHVDVPVTLEDGTVIHVLASHPTPPAFDGPEERNKKRNHDEIRFWADFLDGEGYIVDDSGTRGGLPDSALFVILGDLNADPDEGSSMDDPVGRYLLRHPRIAGTFVPIGSGPPDDLDPDDTAGWGLRVDYVLPSADMEVIDGGVEREENGPSDHYPVWIRLNVGL